MPGRPSCGSAAGTQKRPCACEMTCARPLAAEQTQMNEPRLLEIAKLLFDISDPELSVSYRLYGQGGSESEEDLNVASAGYPVQELQINAFKGGLLQIMHRDGLTDTYRPIAQDSIQDDEIFAKWSGHHRMKLHEAALKL